MSSPRQGAYHDMMFGFEWIDVPLSGGKQAASWLCPNFEFNDMQRGRETEASKQQQRHGIVMAYLFVGHHVADGVAKAGVEGVNVRRKDELESPQRRHLEYLRKYRDVLNVKTSAYSRPLWKYDSTMPTRSHPCGQSFCQASAAHPRAAIECFVSRNRAVEYFLRRRMNGQNSLYQEAYGADYVPPDARACPARTTRETEPRGGTTPVPGEERGLLQPPPPPPFWRASPAAGDW